MKDEILRVVNLLGAKLLVSQLLWDNRNFLNFKLFVILLLSFSNFRNNLNCASIPDILEVVYNLGDKNLEIDFKNHCLASCLP